MIQSKVKRWDGIRKEYCQNYLPKTRVSQGEDWNAALENGNLKVTCIKFKNLECN